MPLKKMATQDHLWVLFLPHLQGRCYDLQDWAKDMARRLSPDKEKLHRSRASRRQWVTLTGCCLYFVFTN